MFITTYVNTHCKMNIEYYNEVCHGYLHMLWWMEGAVRSHVFFPYLFLTHGELRSYDSVISLIPMFWFKTGKGCDMIMLWKPTILWGFLVRMESFMSIYPTTQRYGNVGIFGSKWNFREIDDHPVIHRFWVAKIDKYFFNLGWTMIRSGSSIFRSKLVNYVN